MWDSAAICAKRSLLYLILFLQLICPLELDTFPLPSEFWISKETRLEMAPKLSSVRILMRISLVCYDESASERNNRSERGLDVLSAFVMPGAALTFRMCCTGCQRACQVHFGA